jgi:hypothetical protein
VDDELIQDLDEEGLAPCAVERPPCGVAVDEPGERAMDCAGGGIPGVKNPGTARRARANGRRNV